MAQADRVRVQHMLDAALAICRFIQNRQRTDIDSDLMLFSALLRQLEIIGEAAARLSQNFRQKYPDLPWQKMVGMRNQLIHAYFDVDLNIVWQAVTVEIPNLIPSLKKILE